MPVYLLCFDRPISGKRASHYLGYAARDTERRIALHRKGRAGAAFTTEAHRQGIAFVVANVWSHLGKADERRIKQSKHHARYCRVCSGREWTMPRPSRAGYALKSTLEAPTGENIAEMGNGVGCGYPGVVDAPERGRMRHMLTAHVIGNIGGEPELRYTPNGQPVLNFNVAHNFNEKVGDEWEQRVEWIRCVVFGERGETLMNHLKKGQRIYVQGQLKARPWTDRDDNIRAGLEVIARDVEFAGERQETDRSTYNPAPSGQPTKPKTATATSSTTKWPAADNSDLPF